MRGEVCQRSGKLFVVELCEEGRWFEARYFYVRRGMASHVSCDACSIYNHREMQRPQPAADSHSCRR